MLINGNHIESRTAILIFARSAQADAEQKRFKNAHQVFEGLNRHTLQVARQTGLPYFISSEKDQNGSSFGERFVTAIQEVYDKGFDNVITIGNDSPHLQARHILDTYQKLKSTALVLGPSRDGGFYLMGLQKNHFNADSFLRLPWQTKALSACIIRLVTSRKMETHLLETLVDLDSIEDIDTLLKHTKPLNKEVLKLLKSVINTKIHIRLPDTVFIDALAFTTHFNKGSPRSLLLQ